MEEALEVSLQDPDLLDMRRPTAYLNALLETHGFIPDEETLSEMASTPEMVLAGLEPTPAMIERVRQSCVRRAADLAADLLKAQQAVSKEGAVKKTLEQAVPALIGRFFERMSETARRFVPVDKHDELIEALKQDARVTLTETMATAQDVRR